MKTTGNSILVTGGATGIGLALAEALAARGNAVAVCGRRREKLAEAQRRIPGLKVKVCDLRRAASRLALVRWLETRLPKLNVLVNNAGVQRMVDFRRGPRDLPWVDEEIAINLAAPIHLSALLLPALRRRRKGAAIVNISSGLGFTPLAEVPVYCATKAAIHSWSQSLRHQLRETRIGVFEVAPPIVPTDLAGRRRRPTESAFTMSPEAVAQGIVEALESDTYEVALGAAAHLREGRDSLFDRLNG